MVFRHWHELTDTEVREMWRKRFADTHYAQQYAGHVGKPDRKSMIEDLEAAGIYP